jgi:hypothetical protein
MFGALALTMLCFVGPAGAQEAGGAPAEPWSPDLLLSTQKWVGDATVSASRDGLRVEIPKGRTWSIVAVSNRLLPPTVGAVRVRVSAVGGDARWLIRLYGDIHGAATPVTRSMFEQRPSAGTFTQEIDPRMLLLQRRPPVQVQVGIEGSPGAYAVFRSIQFLPAARPPATTTVPGQRSIPCVDLMSNIPAGFKLKDWRALARAYDRRIFDFKARGQFLPFVWLDDSRINIDGPTFGLPSYAGLPNATGDNHEGVNCMGAILGATVAGIDKSRQAHDYVSMCEAYFNKKNGSRLVLNNMDQPTGGSFWYEIWPGMVFDAIADRYPHLGRLDAILRETSLRWATAVRALTGPDGIPNFDHTAFDFNTMQPVDNGKWKEPDAAAGLAWMEYVAWIRSRDRRCLDSADACLRFLDARKPNPFYEVMMPYGALAAARANAELGRNYNVDKMLNWCFGISDCRGGWGVMVGNWGGIDCSGLLGSVDDGGGYSFAMNTFATAGALVPLVRYDPRYARAIGKWMLHVASAARLFYADELPPDHQSSSFWTGDPECVIAYEGLRHDWQGLGPYATGDPIRLHWGPKTDRGLYGSSYVGLLGGIVGRTSDPKILALDCLATDFFHAPAYPTRLCYNPYTVAKRVALELGTHPRDLYDAVSRRFLARGVAGRACIRIPADRAVLVVAAPAGGRVTRRANRVLIDGVVVAYEPPGRARRK